MSDGALVSGVAGPTDYDDGLAAMFERLASQPDHTPNRRYVAQVIRFTIAGLEGAISSAQLAVECDFAYAVLSDTSPIDAPRLRESLMTLLIAIIENRIPARCLAAEIDTLLIESASAR